MEHDKTPLTADELMAEQATALPDKEVASVLDLNADLDLGLDAAVAANIGSIDSQAYAVAEQDAIISQTIEGEANASADQQSNLEQ